MSKAGDDLELDVPSTSVSTLPVVRLRLHLVRIDGARGLGSSGTGSGVRSARIIDWFELLRCIGLVLADLVGRPATHARAANTDLFDEECILVGFAVEEGSGLFESPALGLPEIAPDEDKLERKPSDVANEDD